MRKLERRKGRMLTRLAALELNYPGSSYFSISKFCLQSTIPVRLLIQHYIWVYLYESKEEVQNILMIICLVESSLEGSKVCRKSYDPQNLFLHSYFLRKVCYVYVVCTYTQKVSYLFLYEKWNHEKISVQELNQDKCKTCPINHFKISRVVH